MRNAQRFRLYAAAVTSLVFASQAYAAPPQKSGSKAPAPAPTPAPPAATADAQAPSSDKIAEAERLFSEGKRLMTASRVGEACRAFEESQKLDPAIGTQFNIADCYERDGRVATAWKMFTDLRGILVRVGDDRAPQAEARTHALEARLPHLVLQIPWAKEASGLVVSLDSEIADARDFGTAIAINPGPHRIRVQATNKKAFETTVTSVEGKTETLEVPPLVDVGKQVVVRNTGLSQKSLGLIVGGVGLAAVGTSVVLGLVAKGNYDDAVSGCTDLGDRFQCPAGDKSGSAASAQSIGTVATIVGGIGVAAVVAGGVLWFTGSRSPKAAEKHTAGLRVVPLLDPSRAGVLLTGAM
jgi:hypothetical protein